jgi:hypothetical protein
MPRADRVELAVALRDKGRSRQEIADIMRVSLHTVGSYFSDPDLAKLRERQARYAGACVDCGNPTTGAVSKSRSPLRCQPCGRLFATTEATWTAEAIEMAMLRWTAEQGEPPRASQWRTRPILESLGLVKDASEWPSTSTVQRVFGKWNLALSSAGLRTLRQGAHPVSIASS